MRNRSKIFSAKIQEQIEGSVISLINGEKDLMSATTIDDPRAVGGVIQKLLGQEFKSLLPKDILKEYIPSFPRRSMADFAFTDNDGFSYMVDCKTHNLDTVFNMPNLYHFAIKFLNLVL